MLKLAMEKCGFAVTCTSQWIQNESSTQKKHLSSTVFPCFTVSDKVSPMCCLLALRTHEVGNGKSKNKSARNHYEHKRVIKADTVLSVCPVWLFL